MEFGNRYLTNSPLSNRTEILRTFYSTVTYFTTYCSTLLCPTFNSAFAHKLDWDSCQDFILYFSVHFEIKCLFYFKLFYAICKASAAGPIKLFLVCFFVFHILFLDDNISFYRYLLRALTCLHKLLR